MKHALVPPAVLLPLLLHALFLDPSLASPTSPSTAVVSRGHASGVFGRGTDGPLNATTPTASSHLSPSATLRPGTTLTPGATTFPLPDSPSGSDTFLSRISAGDEVVIIQDATALGRDAEERLLAGPRAERRFRGTVPGAPPVITGTGTVAWVGDPVLRGASDADTMYPFAPSERVDTVSASTLNVSWIDRGNPGLAALQRPRAVDVPGAGVAEADPAGGAFFYGAREFAVVAAVSRDGRNVTLARGIEGTYRTEVSATAAGQYLYHARIQRVPHYTDCAIPENATVSVGQHWTPASAPAAGDAPPSGGFLVMRCNGTVSLNGTLSARGAGLPGGSGDGYSAHAPGSMFSYAGSPFGRGFAASGGSACAPRHPVSSTSSYGVLHGGGGGHAAHGLGAIGYCRMGSLRSRGGAGYGDRAARLDRFTVGSGGGSGAGVSSAAGGDGGGFVYLAAPTIRVGPAGSIDVRGTDAADGLGEANAVAPGGGGAGGAVLLEAGSLVTSSSPSGPPRAFIRAGGGRMGATDLLPDRPVTGAGGYVRVRCGDVDGVPCGPGSPNDLGPGAAPGSYEAANRTRAAHAALVEASLDALALYNASVANGTAGNASAPPQVPADLPERTVPATLVDGDAVIAPLTAIDLCPHRVAADGALDPDACEASCDAIAPFRDAAAAGLTVVASSAVASAGNASGAAEAVAAETCSVVCSIRDERGNGVNVTVPHGTMRLSTPVGAADVSPDTGYRDNCAICDVTRDPLRWSPVAGACLVDDGVCRPRGHPECPLPDSQCDSGIASSVGLPFSPPTDLDCCLPGTPGCSAGPEAAGLYGTGIDGPYSTAWGTTPTPTEIRPSVALSAGSTSISFTDYAFRTVLDVGSEIAIILSRGQSAADNGRVERRVVTRITSVPDEHDAFTIHWREPLRGSFAASRYRVSLMFNFASVDSSASIFTVSSWTTAGLHGYIFFRVAGELDVTGSSVFASTRGLLGGGEGFEAAKTGRNPYGTSSTTSGNLLQSGGGGRYCSDPSDNCAGGGGGGSYAAGGGGFCVSSGATRHISGGSAVTASVDVHEFWPLGGGGGGGCGEGDDPDPREFGGGGGRGGGFIYIAARRIVGADSDFVASGGGGGGRGTIRLGEAGGGGGGGAGTIVIMAGSYDHTGSASATALGGSAGASDGNIFAGSGGHGLVRIECGEVNGVECESSGAGEATAVAVLGGNSGSRAVSPVDLCPNDPGKTHPGLCGCGLEDPAEGGPVCISEDPATGSLTCVRGCDIVDPVTQARVCVPDGGSRVNTTAVIGDLHGADSDCAVCDVSRSTSLWSSRPGSCFVDGRCHADGADRVVYPSGKAVPCEHCNRSISQLAWSARDGYCTFLGDWDSSVPGYDPDLPYLCLRHEQPHPREPCRECAAARRASLNDSLPFGDLVDDDRNACATEVGGLLDAACRDARRCRRGQCVAWLPADTLPSLGRSVASTVFDGEDGSFVQEPLPQGAAFASANDTVGLRFVVERAGGVTVTHLGVPGDLRAHVNASAEAHHALNVSFSLVDAVVAVYERGSGKVVAQVRVSANWPEDLDALDAHLDGGYTYLELSPGPVLLPHRFDGVLAIVGRIPARPSHDGPAPFSRAAHCAARLDDAAVHSGAGSAAELRESLRVSDRERWTSFLVGDDEGSAAAHPADSWLRYGEIVRGPLAAWDEPVALSARGACRAETETDEDGVLSATVGHGSFAAPGDEHRRSARIVLGRFPAPAAPAAVPANSTRNPTDEEVPAPSGVASPWRVAALFGHPLAAASLSGHVPPLSDAPTTFVNWTNGTNGTTATMLPRAGAIARVAVPLTWDGPTSARHITGEYYRAAGYRTAMGAPGTASARVEFGGIGNVPFPAWVEAPGVHAPYTAALSLSRTLLHPNDDDAGEITLDTVLLPGDTSARLPEDAAPFTCPDGPVAVEVRVNGFPRGALRGCGRPDLEALPDEVPLGNLTWNDTVTVLLAPAGPATPLGAEPESRDSLTGMGPRFVNFEVEIVAQEFDDVIASFQQEFYPFVPRAGWRYELAAIPCAGAAAGDPGAPLSPMCPQLDSATAAPAQNATGANDTSPYRYADPRVDAGADAHAAVASMFAAWAPDDLERPDAVSVGRVMAAGGLRAGIAIAAPRYSGAAQDPSPVRLHAAGGDLATWVDPATGEVSLDPRDFAATYAGGPGSDLLLCDAERDQPIAATFPRAVLCTEAIAGPKSRAALGDAELVARDITIDGVGGGGGGVRVVVYAGARRVANTTCADGASCAVDAIPLGRVAEDEPVCAVVEPVCSSCAACVAELGSAVRTARVAFAVERAVSAARVASMRVQEPAQCVIDGVCRVENEVKDGEDCLRCETAISAFTWTSRIFEPCATCNASSLGGGCRCNNAGTCLDDDGTIGQPPPPPEPVVLELPPAEPLQLVTFDLTAVDVETTTLTTVDLSADVPPVPTIPAVGLPALPAGAPNLLADGVAFFDVPSGNPLADFPDVNTHLKALWNKIEPLFSALPGFPGIGGLGTGSSSGSSSSGSSSGSGEPNATAIGGAKAGFDLSGLDVNLLGIFKANGLSISGAMSSGAFPHPGTARLVIGKLSTGVVPAIEALLPFDVDLGFIQMPPGIPDINAYLPDGVQVYFDPVVPIKPVGVDLTIPIPDFELIPGVFKWEDATFELQHFEKVINVAATLDFTVPVLDRHFGTFDMQARFLFGTTFKTLPTTLISFKTTNDLLEFMVVEDVLWISVRCGVYDHGAKKASLEVKVRAEIPGYSPLGTYVGKLDLSLPRNKDVDAPPVSASAPNVTRTSTIVVVDVEAVDPAMIPIVPGIISLSPEKFYLNTDTSELKFQASANATIPGYGDLGKYRGTVEMQFPEPNFRGGRPAFTILIAAIEPEYLTVIPDVISIRPQSAFITSIESFMSFQADLKLDVPGIGHFGEFACKLDLIFPLSPHYVPAGPGGNFSGGAPDVQFTFKTLVEEPDEPELFKLIPGILELSVHRGSVLKNEGKIEVAGRINLAIPGVGDIGKFLANVKLLFQPGLKGSPEIVLTFEAAPEVTIDIIPGEVELTILSGRFDTVLAEIRLEGRVNLPLFGDVEGIVIAKWKNGRIKGSPESVCLYIGTPTTEDSSSALSRSGLDASDIDGVPLPKGLIRLERVCFRPRRLETSILLAADRSEKIPLVPGLVTVYQVELEIIIAFARRGDPGGKAVKTVSASGGKKSKKGKRSLSLGFELRGSWSLGADAIVGEVHLAKCAGEFRVGAKFEKLSVRDIAVQFVGELPGILDDALATFDIVDAEFSTVLGLGKSSKSSSKSSSSSGGSRGRSSSSGGGGKTRLFRFAGLPDSDFIREFIDPSAKVELLTGKLAGKNLFALVSAIDVPSVFAYIGRQIKFDALSKLPFPGQAPLKLGFSSKTISYRDFPQVSFDNIPSPPDLIQGFSFGFDLVAPDGACNALCEIIVEKMPFLKRLRATVALGRVNGKFTISLRAEADLELVLGPVTLRALALNLIVPIPSIAKLQIFFSAEADIELSPGRLLTLEFKIGYKPKSLFVSAFLNGYIENFFMIPFFTAGKFFVEAEVNQSPTVAVGADVIVGTDCLTPRGQFDASRGCLFARGAIGIGLDLFFIVDFPILTLLRLLRFAKVPIPKLPPLLERDGWVDQMKLSWSSKERHLPNGEILPVGIGFQGTYATMLGLFEVQMRAIIPFTPTMVKLLLILTGVGAAKVIPQFIAELLTGYELLLEAKTPAYSFINNNLQLYESRENRENGPLFFLQCIIKPLSLEFGYRAVVSMYVNVLHGLYELDALFSQEIFGFKIMAEGRFFGIKYGFLIEARLAVEGLKSIFNPRTILDRSLVRANLHVDTDSFNNEVLAPLNQFANTVIDAVRTLVLKIPVLGEAVAALLDVLKEILQIRFYKIFASGLISYNTIGFNFEFAGRIFGFDLSLKLHLPETSVPKIADAVWKKAIKPIYEKLANTRRGPSLPHCARGERQYGPICADYCRGGYRDLMPMCLQNCRSGYKDLGVGCLRIHTKGPKICKKWKFKYPCGCSGSGYKFIGVRCVKKHFYFKHLYFRTPKPIRKCERSGLTSREFWTPPFLCYEKCSKGQQGLFKWCVDDRLVPG